MSPATTVLVTHEHLLMRECLADTLAAEPDLTVVAATGDGRHAVLDAQRTAPDIVILRPSLPRLSAVAACEQIKRTVDGTHVLVLADREEPALLLEAVEAGADGYVTFGGGIDKLVSAMRRIHRGETVVPPLLLGSLLRDLIVRRRAAHRSLQRFIDLTGREKEVLGLLVAGCDRDAIAAELGISPETSRTHIQNLIGKLGVHSRLEATALAVTSGWTELLPTPAGTCR